MAEVQRRRWRRAEGQVKVVIHEKSYTRGSGRRTGSARLLPPRPAACVGRRRALPVPKKIRHLPTIRRLPHIEKAEGLGKQRRQSSALKGPFTGRMHPDWERVVSGK